MSKTVPYFTALDMADLNEEPTTVPLHPPPEVPTERPSADDLEALVDATRGDAPWRRSEPVFACDPESCRLYLARRYEARQRDRYGNVFLIDCPLGVHVELPTTRERARALRSELVRAALHVVVSFRVLPHSGAGELSSPLDDEWRRAIVEAFQLGDAGALERG